MNAVDYAVFRGDDVETVMAIHFRDDYGNDAAVGARTAAERHGMAFVDVGTRPGAGNQSGAVAEVVDQKPDLVILATSPTETGPIVGQAAAQGFDGMMITVGPGWDDALLDGPDAAAVRSLLLAARPWRAFAHGTVGHGAMRKALGDVEPDDAYVSGWIWSYRLRAALQVAVDAGDLTRQGLLAAATSPRVVDYEGMLPPPSGIPSVDTPAGRAVRRTVFRTPGSVSATDATKEEDFFNGLTVEPTTSSSRAFGTGRRSGRPPSRRAHGASWLSCATVARSVASIRAGSPWSRWPSQSSTIACQARVEQAGRLRRSMTVDVAAQLRGGRQSSGWLREDGGGSS
ncbi:hypothetical protein BH23ACT10_BH23ACT10_09850 [soil metagenome]